MRARYYSVELMRFINEDIVLGDIGNSNSLNRYTYVEGNPATMVDPFGLEAEKASAKAWKWGTDILKTIAGVGIMCIPIPGAKAVGAGLIINGGTGLVMDILDACGVSIDPKTGAIISDVIQIAGGIACLFNPATAAYGASQIGSGIGGIAGGYIAEGTYKAFTGEDSETAFLVGNTLGNLLGDLAGAKIYTGIASKAAAAANDGGKNSSNTLGKQGEDFASNELGLPHNTETISINGRDRIPDFYDPNRGIIGESKNVGKLSYTRQLRDYVDKATEMGTQLELYVRQNTTLSKPLQEAIDKGLININHFPW